MTKIEMIDGIGRLFDEKSQLSETVENRRRLALWNLEIEPDEYSPGILSPLLPEHREEAIPITADWDRMQWAILLGFSIKDYYTDPLSYLYWTLKVDLYRFQNFPDDTPLLKSVPIYLSVALEPSLFGVRVNYSEEHEPLFTSSDAVLKSVHDLSTLKLPDFYSSGLMPLSHKFFSEISRILPPDYTVVFPKWGRSPWGTACGVRGMENLLIDTIENPRFVHELMAVITDSRKEYTKQRRKLVGSSDNDSTCYNDECSPPMQSPASYEEYCFPYENDLCEFYGGLRWWHSCGNKSSLLDTINEFTKPVRLIDFVTWDDELREVCSKLPRQIPFSIRPSSKDINEKNETVIQNNVRGIVSMMAGRNFYLRVDGFEPNRPTIEDVYTMQRYLNVARSECRQNST